MATDTSSTQLQLNQQVQDEYEMARRLRTRLTHARAVVERDIGCSLTKIIPPDAPPSQPDSVPLHRHHMDFPSSPPLPLLQTPCLFSSNDYSDNGSPDLSSSVSDDANDIAQTILMLATPPAARTNVRAHPATTLAGTMPVSSSRRLSFSKCVGNRASKGKP